MPKNFPCLHFQILVGLWILDQHPLGLELPFDLRRRTYRSKLIASAWMGRKM
jgi:hypothetical protein